MLPPLQASLCAELVGRLLSHAPALQRAAAALAALDCLAAFAELSREQRYSRPLLAEEDVLTIRQGAQTNQH